MSKSLMQTNEWYYGSNKYLTAYYISLQFLKLSKYMSMKTKSLSLILSIKKIVTLSHNDKMTKDD